MKKDANDTKIFKREITQNLLPGPNEVIPGEETPSSTSCVKTNRKWKILAILVLCITIILPVAFVLGRNTNTGKVLHLSDLHYDPIYEGNALNTRKCACNLVKTENIQIKFVGILQAILHQSLAD